MEGEQENMMILLPDRLLINTDNIVSGEPSKEYKQIPYILQGMNRGDILLTKEQEDALFYILDYVDVSMKEGQE